MTSPSYRINLQSSPKKINMVSPLVEHAEIIFPFLIISFIVLCIIIISLFLEHTQEIKKIKERIEAIKEHLKGGRSIKAE